MSPNEFITTTITILAGAVLIACTPAQGYHPESDVPENHARVHKPDYRGGEVERGELEPVDPQADVERQEPPERGSAAWSDPQGDPEGWRVTQIAIDRGIAEACGIDQARAQFDFDSARLDAEAEQTVAAIADCLDDGALAGHTLEIIGHADPRGTDEYNRELGMSRAESVAEVLIDNGLSAQRIDVDSRGESQASEDPSDWPEDRRVDIRIAG